MNVIGVLCLVDREQGGRLNIERALAEIPSDDLPPTFHALFTASDIRAARTSQASDALTPLRKRRCGTRFCIRDPQLFDAPQAPSIHRPISHRRPRQ